MTRLEVRLEGDPVLRQKATRIGRMDDSIRKLAADLWETMEASEGIGIAAPQVGISRRLVVIHLPEGYVEDDAPEVSLTLLNPEIIRSRGAVVGMEGCLSIPGWQGEVERADQVTVRAMDLTGKEIRLKAETWLARVLQHEIDHLDGILYTDRMREEDAFYRVEQQDDDDGDAGDHALTGAAGAGRD